MVISGVYYLIYAGSPNDPEFLENNIMVEVWNKEFVNETRRWTRDATRANQSMMSFCSHDPSPLLSGTFSSGFSLKSLSLF